MSGETDDEIDDNPLKKKKGDWKPKDGGKRPQVKILMEWESEAFDPWFIKNIKRDVYYREDVEDGLGYLFKVIFVDETELEFKYDYETERDEKLIQFEEKMGRLRVFVI